REAFLLEHVRKGAVHEANAVLEPRLLVLRGGFERAPEIVEDRDQLLDQPLVRTLRQRRVLARVAFAEVVELRREPLEPAEQLVALGLETGNVWPFDGCRGNLPVPPNPLHRSAIGDGRLRRRLAVFLRVVCHGYAFRASCSSSMTS